MKQTYQATLTHVGTSQRSGFSKTFEHIDHQSSQDSVKNASIQLPALCEGFSGRTMHTTMALSVIATDSVALTGTGVRYSRYGKLDLTGRVR